MIKSILLLAITSLLGTAARAEDPAPPAFTGNVSLTTNYKYRGQDQSATPGKLKPAIQGGFDYSSNGFYIGNWNSNIGWLNSIAPSANIEMDFYGGYRGEIVKDVGYDVGILQYAYPGATVANTTEIYGAVSYGIASLKYSSTVSKDYFNLGSGIYSGRNTGYLDLSANYELAKGLTLNGHIGFTRYASALRNNVSVNGVSLPNYYDYKVGLTYDLGSGFSIAGAVVSANKKDYYGDVNKAQGILTVSKSL